MTAPASEPVAVLMPLLIATAVTVCTIFIRALAFIGIVNFVRHEIRVGGVGVRYRRDVLIVGVATMLALAALLTDVLLWGVTLMLCGEFSSLDAAFYYSVGTYTSLGGGLQLSGAWKLLGPLETVDGLLMFGMSTALLFGIIQRLIQSKIEHDEQSAAAR